MYWNYYCTDKQITFKNSTLVEATNVCTNIKADEIKLLLANNLIKKHTLLPPVSFFNVNEYGKPFLPDTHRYYVNFSHSDNICVSVLSEVPCGIDIQGVKPYNKKVADKYFSDEQLKTLSSAYAHSQDLYYTEFWTQFEAICKCDGRGISRAFPDILELRAKMNAVSFWDDSHSDCVSIATPLY